MEQLDCIVVGAGVIGLAIARALALHGRQVLVLEREAHFGTITSARNSEVIHAGLYYPPGSLKARLCVRGRALLYRYCDAHGIAHRRCGKLVVAADPGQHPALHAIAATAAGNGVDDLQWLDRDQALALEPQLACSAALLSPSTGILDSHAYMLALLGEAEAHGAQLACHSEATGLAADGGWVRVDCAGLPLRARCVINAAGLDAPALAARTEGLDDAHTPHAGYAKGSYFTLSGRSPFSRLVYPVPEPGGLGTHLTLDLAGQARFGPDVEWVQAPDYQVDPRRAQHFYAAIRRYWPALPDDALAPGYAGVRPKLGQADAAASDFLIEGPARHGMAGLVNLFGIESPGLTASLAIAEMVAALVGEEIPA